MAKKVETKTEEPKLPGIDINPMKWVSVNVGHTQAYVCFVDYISSRPLSSDEAEKLHRESRLQALREAKLTLDRELAEMEKGG